MGKRSMGKASALALAAALLGFSAACGTTGSEAPPAQAAVATAKPSLAAALTPVTVARDVAAREGSMIALGVLDGRRALYVGDEDEHLVRVVDVEREEELSTTKLDGRPGQLLVREDGKLVVALRDRARVVVLAPSGGARDPFTPVGSVAVAAEPIGLALTPEDDTLVVASGWGRAVTIIDARSLTVQAARSIAREARSVVISDDSHRALVSHAAGGALTVVDLVGDPKVRESTVDGSEHGFGRDDEEVRLTGRVPMQGYALAKTKGPLGGRVLMPQVLAFSGDATVASEGYGGGGERLAPELFNVAVVDQQTMRPLRTSLELPTDAELDHARKPVPQRRCLLPRAAATRGRDLFVACLGIDTVVAYDAASVRPRAAERKRFRVAEGPTGLAIDERANVLWVWSQFARSLSRIDLATEGDGVRTFALAHHAPASVDDPEIALGRRLFHAVGDMRIARDGRACASCHPDGRDDGLVWSTPNGPRQTPMLAGRTVGTAPYSWQGDTHTVADHLEHTLARLEGKGLPSEDRDAIAKYLAAMPTPPPIEVSTEEARLAERGAALFASPEVGCASCHGARGDDPDGLPHDVKSHAQGDKAKSFDTPSLKYLAGSAPYFHDGRYTTLRELLRATDGNMGHTKQLSDEDKDALEAFLETL